MFAFFIIIFFKLANAYLSDVIIPPARLQVVIPLESSTLAARNIRYSTPRRFCAGRKHGLAMAAPHRIELVAGISSS